CIAVQDRRTAFAVAVLAVHLAEVFFPNELAVEVETIQAIRAERRKDVFAVADRRRRREASSYVAGFVRRSVMHSFLPENLPALAAHGQHGEFVASGPIQIVVRARPNEPRLDGIAVRNRGGQKDAVATDDRRGMALTRECRLPADVLGLAPFNRGLRIRSNAAGKRAAPLRPGVRLQLVAFG